MTWENNLMMSTSNHSGPCFTKESFWALTLSLASGEIKFLSKKIEKQKLHLYRPNCIHFIIIEEENLQIIVYIVESTRVFYLCVCVC